MRVDLSDVRCGYFRLLGMYVPLVLSNASQSLPSSLVLTRFGRRTLYLTGLSTMACVLLIIGGMGFTDSTAAKWVSGGLLGKFTYWLGTIAGVFTASYSLRSLP